MTCAQLKKSEGKKMTYGFQDFQNLAENPKKGKIISQFEQYKTETR